MIVNGTFGILQLAVKEKENEYENQDSFNSDRNRIKLWLYMREIRISKLEDKKAYRQNNNKAFLNK
jgi:hypothetical protein